MTRTIDASQVYRSSQLVPIDLVRLTTYTDRDADTVDRRFFFARQPIRFDWNNLGSDEDFWPVIQRIGTLIPEMNHLAGPNDVGVLTKPLQITLSNEIIPSETDTPRLIKVLQGHTLERARVEWTQILLAERPTDGRVDLSSMVGNEHTFWYRGRVTRVGPIDEEVVVLQCETDMPALKWTRELDQLQNDPKDYGKRVPAPFGEDVWTRATGTKVGWVTTLAKPLVPGDTGSDTWVTDPTGFPDSPTTFTLKIGNEEVTAVRSGATQINISVRGLNSTVDGNHQAGEICIEMITGNIDFTFAREDEWGGDLQFGISGGYILNPQNNELVYLDGTAMGGRSDVVTGEVRSIVRYSAATLRAALENVFGKAFGGSTTILLPFSTKEHWLTMPSSYGDAMHNGENIGTNPKFYGDPTDATYESVRAWWAANTISNSSRVIRRWRGRIEVNVNNTHSYPPYLYCRMQLYDFNDNNLGGLVSPVYENVDIAVDTGVKETFGLVGVGEWRTPTAAGVTLAALEGTGPYTINARYGFLMGWYGDMGSPYFAAADYIEWTFYGLEIEVDSATPELAGSFMGFGLDIWGKLNGRYSPTTTPDYKCGDSGLMKHPVDIIRFWIEEVGGGTLDYDTYDQAYLDLGPDAAWSFDARSLGDTWEGILARMAYEARAVIVPEEAASGTVWKILTAPAAYAWIGVTADPITEWEEFVEADQDVGSHATHASRFSFVYAPYWPRGDTEDAYTQAIVANKDQNDLSARVPTANLTAAEAKIGAVEADTWAFKCIQDEDTAHDVAGWYVSERSRMPARLFAVNGVPWWQAYNTEVGDRLLITPPWDVSALKCRVISYAKDPETEKIDLRLVELPALPPQTVSMNVHTASESMWSDYEAGVYFLAESSFTIRFRHQEKVAVGSRETVYFFINVLKWDSALRYSIAIRYEPDVSVSHFFVKIYGSNDSAHKEYRWNADAGNGYLFDTIDQWYDTFIVFDQAAGDIYFYTGTTENVSNVGTADTKINDQSIDPGYLGNQMKRFRVGQAAVYWMHDVQCWDKVLTADEIAYLAANKNHDPRENEGDYTSKDQLDLYFRCGDPASDWGKNHGNSSIPVDIAYSGGMDADDIISQAP